MAIRWDYVSTTTRYRGHAYAGASTSDPVWRIARLTFDAQGRHTTTEFADGNSQFDNIWANRASLTYA